MGSNPTAHPIYYPHANQRSLEPRSFEGIELSDGKAIEPSEMFEYIRHINRYALVKPRTYWYEFPFFIIINDARQKFCLGNRPEDLAYIDTITQRALNKHQTYLDRLERFPLDKAEYYLRLKEVRGINTVRGLSEVTGEDWSCIARILRTLNLPEPVKNFLRSNKNDP
ncbi:MAG: hypothetical protein ABH869_07975, partial [Candidatus Omnitrophota bacterium]